MKKINMKIKQCDSDHHRRWMRCIKADDLDDYVDIMISPGSNNGQRHIVLSNASFLAGTWRAFFIHGSDVKNTEYDYYYLYYRDKDGNFIEGESGEYSESSDWHVGLHKDGDRIGVDIKTNKIVKKEPFQKPFAQKAKS